jgi:polyisoprenoid-binding protein YceI
VVFRIGMSLSLCVVSVRGKLLLPAALLLAALAGCALRSPVPPPAAAPAERPAPHEGVPYDIVPDASLLTVRVYRGGALGSAGHNHVIASHELRGTIYLAAEPLRSSFEVHIPVATRTIDEPRLRAQQAPADFPPDVPESARQGTRRNMLGPALLDAEHYPEIVLEALRLERPAAADAAAHPQTVLARLQSTVRGQLRTLTVPVRYEREGGALVVSGEAPLRQSDLGLTPFSAMLGALQVQDEMRVSFRIVARGDERSQCSPSSASNASAWYTLRSPSSMIVGSTATARFSCASNQ